MEKLAEKIKAPTLPEETIVEDEPKSDENGVDEESEVKYEEAEMKREEEDYQKNFSVIGSHKFIPLKPIQFTSSWINDAIWFPAAIKAENLEPLETITELPVEIFDAAVLPKLLRELRHPSAIRPRDVAISSPTGSGKTLCYALPCLAAVGARPRNQPVALIIVPVQPLVQQVEKELNRFNAYGAKVFAMSGAETYAKERRKLFDENGRSAVDIIIATPDRLVRHLCDDVGELDLSRVRLLVIDEADRMGDLLRMEWLELVEQKINSTSTTWKVSSLKQLVESRSAPRKILLSATLSKDVEKLKLWALHRPQLFSPRWDKEKVETRTQNGAQSDELVLPESISHRIVCCSLKYHPLYVYQEIVKSSWERVLIFSNQRQSSERLSQVLAQLAGTDFKVGHLTADLFGRRRGKILQRFQSGGKSVLIASDVLSRGIDLANIDVVFNYDCPKSELLFVHRAGRTGRAGTSGEVVTVIENEQKHGFKFMLKKSGLLNNLSEEFIEDKAFEKDQTLEKYRQSLAEVKAQLITKDKRLNKKVEYNRLYLANKTGKRRWNQQVDKK
ncbi:unnamed protein product, partial [Mesorhabditis belari]|uniref:ATP-dependent RNA helicase n=1 Tax=Mesorhabditis belari TaxID=2138241 RepID=A0AAF3FFV6_9BILA